MPARIVIQMKRTAVVVRLVDAAVVHPVGIGPNQRVVSVVDHRHWKAAGETGDARKATSRASGDWDAKKLIEREAGSRS